MNKIITNNPNGYAEKRNIFSRYSGKFLFKKDIFDFGLKVTHRLTKKSYSLFWKGLYFSIKDQRTPCIFFNSINLGSNPWKVYFETKLPRLGKAPKVFYDIAVRRLAKDNCSEIIAISRCAYEMQLNYIKAEYPQYYDVIESKMKIQLPPQKPLIDDYGQKPLPSNKIVFTLVGSDFFRKGGGEVLQVFNQLIPNYPQLQLNIVSSLSYGDYATHTTKKDYINALQMISKFPKNINHYVSLPNSDVLELFKKSHVGLLPTWADSFGYSVLEAQASGCPVITTDIRALPEINSDEIGWLIYVDKTNNKDGDIFSQEKRELFSKNLYENLYLIILQIVNSPESIKEKGVKCINQIKSKYEAGIS